VDYHTAGAANQKDRYTRIEAEVTYQVNFYRLRSFRVGAGFLDGVGADSKKSVLAGKQRSTSLVYSFAEVGLDISEILGLDLRFTTGNNSYDPQKATQLIFGYEGRLRVGRHDGTRLVLGASTLTDLGNQGFMDLHIESFKKIPLSAGIVVSNLPSGSSDLGVRLRVKGGYRFNETIALNLRAGWNLRSIDYFGFTAGGGLEVNW
jgi:hypothetical protein